MKKIFTLAAAALATQAFAAIDSAPESAEVQTWYFNAQVFYPAEEIVNQEVQVAIDGNDLYFNVSLNGETYTFAMNGQTGKFVGDLPQDKGLYWRWFAILLCKCRRKFKNL